jgi:hypothetical protein
MRLFVTVSASRKVLYRSPVETSQAGDPYRSYRAGPLRAAVGVVEVSVNGWRCWLCGLRVPVRWLVPPAWLEDEQ